MPSIALSSGVPALLFRVQPLELSPAQPQLQCSPCLRAPAGLRQAQTILFCLHFAFQPFPESPMGCHPVLPLLRAQTQLGPALSPGLGTNIQRASPWFNIPDLLLQGCTCPALQCVFIKASGSQLESWENKALAQGEESRAGNSAGLRKGEQQGGSQS